jgi:DNA repair protein RecN (Recombination protein N)
LIVLAKRAKGMLQHLSIRNVAIVDAVDIDFATGMTAITGETGAGKSLLVDALHLLLGGRSDAMLVRKGADEASVTGLFCFNAGAASGDARALLQAAGVPLTQSDDNNVDLIVRRVIVAQGRSRAYINDTLVTLATLHGVMRNSIDIMGQHEHQSLLRREHQLELLDAYGEHAALRQKLAETYTTLKALVDERDALSRSEAEKEARLDFVRFQINELETVDPRPGELVSLLEQQKRLASVDKLRHAARAAEAVLYSDEGAACTQLGEASRRLHALVDSVPELEVVVKNIEEALALASDAARDLGRILGHVDDDPEKLEQIAARVDALRTLARKHSIDADSLSMQLEKLREERDALENTASRLADIDTRMQPLRRSLVQHAEELTLARKHAAKDLAKKCVAALAGLAMPAATMLVSVDALDARSDDVGGVLVDTSSGQRFIMRHGGDRIEFLLAANPGEPARALAKVASGGELSRVALALRQTLADRGSVPTYVFDEVDAAIGGSTAEAVGKALKGVSKGHQVICITHLPQVAALADVQLSVSKHVHGRVTKVAVGTLQASERVDELARMLGTSTAGDSARRHAQALLNGVDA